MRYLLFNKPCGIISQFADEGTVPPQPEPATAPRPVTPHSPTSWIAIRLREGKQRRIRHMTAAVGLSILRLVRVTDWTASDEIAPTGGRARLNTACQKVSTL